MPKFPDWSEWQDLNPEGFEQLPKSKGIYLIRTLQPIERVLGASPLVYIGKVKTDSDRTLADRIPECFNPSVHVVAPRLEELRKIGVRLQFCYSETDSPDDCEKTLLKFFEKVHLELSPMNKQV